MWWEILKEHKGKVIGVTAGLFFGIIYLLVGFWDTIVFIVFVSTGLYFGKKFDNREDLLEILDRILPGKFK